MKIKGPLILAVGLLLAGFLSGCAGLTIEKPICVFNCGDKTVNR
jgi:hypothetical protein